MKLFSLLPVVDLSKAVEFTEFLYRDPYLSKGVSGKKFNERFPVSPKMPTEHPAMTAQPTAKRTYEFVSEMTVGEAVFFEMVQERTVVRGEENAVEARRLIEQSDQKRADQKAIEKELANLDLRFKQGWLQRLFMQKMFQENRVSGLEDFKRIMHSFHKQDHIESKVSHEYYQRQNGKDNVSFLEGQHDMRKNDIDFARIQMNLQNKHELIIDQMRQKLAEQNASLALMSTQQLQHTLLEWKQNLQDSQKANNAIAMKKKVG